MKYCLLFILLLAGCNQYDTELKIEKRVEKINTCRIEITRIGVIPDGLAYGRQRGLYIIKDTKTGCEYIGVSGIGISEVGSHQSGKDR